MSGGQRRRVDIARALINRPKLLFLDEPTTGLDPKTRLQVWEIIHNLRKETGLTVFLTTHYMEETVDCDNVVIIDSGKIVANDSPHNLKKIIRQTALFGTRKKILKTIIFSRPIISNLKESEMRIKSKSKTADRLLKSQTNILKLSILRLSKAIWTMCF